MKLFGTDGIRGIVNEEPFIAETIVMIAKRTVQCTQAKTVLIGRDTRSSGCMIENALCAGLLSMGCEVKLAGILPTPGISFLTKTLSCDLGIAITASHNPAEYNGIKIFGADGFKISDDMEEEIENSMNDQVILSKRLATATPLENAAILYKQHLLQNTLNMCNKTIVIDCANGASFSIAQDVFKSICARVITLHNNPNGENINAECGALHPEKLQEEVLAHHADLGFAFDGDADRITVVDNGGNVVAGDHLLALLALHYKKQGQLSKDTLVATIMSNSWLDFSLKVQGIAVVRTPVGDRSVSEEMRRQGYFLGGENSGHVIIGASSAGDGLKTAVIILEILKDQSLQEIIKDWTLFPQTTINIPVKEKMPLENIPSINDCIKEVKNSIGIHGRVFIRYSGTENLCRIMVEGKEEEDVHIGAKKIAKTIQEVLG